MDGNVMRECYYCRHDWTEETDTHLCIESPNLGAGIWQACVHQWVPLETPKTVEIMEGGL